MTRFDFSSRTVVVYGGTSGIGLASALAFAQSGASVVVVGRNEGRLLAAKEQLLSRNNSDRIAALAGDVSIRSEVLAVAEEAKARFGSLDIIVNCSGVWALTPLERLDGDVVQEHLDVNVKGVLHCMEAAAMVLADGGSVVNLGSFAGVIPMRNAAVYSASKAAVTAITRSAAVELARRDIRVNCVVPGVIRTPMTNDYIVRNEDKVLPPIALGRVGRAEEVASCVLFLCSEAASYVTGAVLEVSGGKFSTQP